jgi:hypothetical protein
VRPVTEDEEQILLTSIELVARGEVVPWPECFTCHERPDEMLFGSSFPDDPDDPRTVTMRFLPCLHAFTMKVGADG